MASRITELRNQGLVTLGIGIIRLYQNTISRATPPRCRYFPSCSKYAIEAIQNFGLETGIKLASKRIRRCKRPYGGYDPIPNHLTINSHSGRNIRSNNISQERFDTIKENQNPLDVNNFDHQFKLILSYPTNREFYSQKDLKCKLAEFHEYVLEISQYAILYKVDKVEAGIINDHYLIRFSGTTSSAYLENQLDEIIGLLIAQLESFFTIVQENEFQPLYFEVDGQVYLKPEANQPSVPKEYSPQENFWFYTNYASVWDDYWGSYFVSQLFEIFFNSLELAAGVTNEVGTDFINPIEVNRIINSSNQGGNFSENNGCDLSDGCGDLLSDGCGEICSQGCGSIFDGCS